MTSKKKPTKVNRGDPGLKHGFRSGLEFTFAKDLEEQGIPYEYESTVVKYTKPESSHRYTPDFSIESKNGKTIIIETKGRFVSADRVKHLLIKRQHPELDIRFVFSRCRQRLSKRSKTTYGDWCERHGFMYAESKIPKEWLNE
jgi:predicted nuclease of restriction endonuclease-like RecB superfamily